MKIKKYQLSLAVLECLSEQDNYVLRANLLGLVGQRGKVESHLDLDFSSSEKSLLNLVIGELQEKGLVQSAYKDIIGRGDDLIISDKGRAALQKKSLDDLDDLLVSINSKNNLLEMRYGAYDAALIKNRDWQRHAATSLVELIDHTLRTIAPKEKIDKQGAGKERGSTRKLRIKYFIKQKLQRRSKNTEEIVEKSFELVEAIRTKLEAIKHTSANSDQEIKSLIKLTEDALFYLLA